MLLLRLPSTAIDWLAYAASDDGNCLPVMLRLAAAAAAITTDAGATDADAADTNAADEDFDGAPAANSAIGWLA